jgi:hypothetical protein
MDAKEKAKQLIEKFIEPTKVPNIKNIWVEDFDAAKQCALIAVDEILESCYLEKEWFFEEVKEEIKRSYFL